MTAGGIIPHHPGHQVCVCGEPIKPCPVMLGPGSDLCRGYVHVTTLQHAHPGGQEGLAEPQEASVPP